MRYSDYNKLTDNEKKQLHWRRHPRVRIATIFTVLFAIALSLVLLRILQNRRIHVNRKPNKLEAFTMAKVFVKDKIKQAGTATFPNNDFQSYIDTAQNSYRINSIVNSQDSTGKTVTSHWQVQLAYSGGDWADRSSWQLKELKISR